MSKFEFRRLNSKDIFPMARIITKIGFKEFKGCLTSSDITQLVTDVDNKDSLTTAVGLSIALDIGGVVLANLEKCEKEAFEFLSSVSGMSVKELEGMALSDFAELILEFFKKDELKDFFKVVSKLLK